MTLPLQGLFEGMKAYRTVDGRILLFRPEENALRMINGADRLSMPALPVDAFVNAVKQTVIANKRWVNVLACLLHSIITCRIMCDLLPRCWSPCVILWFIF